MGDWGASDESMLSRAENEAANWRARALAAEAALEAMRKEPTAEEVEAVARAICLVSIREHGAPDAVDPFGWGEYIPDAKAALTAFLAARGKWP